MSAFQIIVLIWLSLLTFGNFFLAKIIYILVKDQVERSERAKRLAVKAKEVLVDLEERKLRRANQHD